MIASDATKGKTRYRYYVRSALHHDGATGILVSALVIESAVGQMLSRALGDPRALAATHGLTIQSRPTAAGRSRARAGSARRHARTLLRGLVAGVRVIADGIEVDLVTAAVAENSQLSAESDAPALTTLHSALRLTRTVRAVRLVQSNGVAPAAVANVLLIGLVLKARRW